jgi:lysophospholipase L1-like esterase
MRRAFAAVTVLVLALALAPAAPAKSAQARIAVGQAALAPPGNGRAALLVPVTYPIVYNGRQITLRVNIAGAPSTPPLFSRARLSAGLPRVQERLRRFTFVHRVALSPEQAAAVRGGAKVSAEVPGRIDVNHDGTPELSQTSSALLTLQPGVAGPPLCATVPQLHAYYSYRAATRLPTCTTLVRWRIARAPKHGKARISDGWLRYVPAAKFRGTDTLELARVPVRGALVSAEGELAPVVIRVGSAAHAVVRAIGDSVTAGFGYYDTGRPMPLVNLLECKPGDVTLVNSCSSNSAVLNNEAKKAEYAPDFGLANNISWAAQWSNEHGITDYENLAISGSEPSQWAPGGPLYPTTKQIESEDPDYILMTIGANPLLDETLFGIDPMGCAIYADIFGNYKQCVEEAFAKIRLHENLENLYRNLVQNTDATIYLMQYHLSIPSTALAYTAVQIAEMAKMMNAEIAKVAGEVNPQRLQVVAPPHFNVGIDLAPVYPSKFSCSRFGYEVDGPSVQIKATQYELLLSHPLSFCKGPVSGPPWVITGDTGIHPSATGYTQMASQVPAPE